MCFRTRHLLSLLQQTAVEQLGTGKGAFTPGSRWTYNRRTSKIRTRATALQFAPDAERLLDGPQAPLLSGGSLPSSTSFYFLNSRINFKLSIWTPQPAFFSLALYLLVCDTQNHLYLRRVDSPPLCCSLLCVCVCDLSHSNTRYREL